MKKVTCNSTRHFVCRRCKDVGDGWEEPVEVLYDEVETVKGVCYVGDRLNASGGCETAVTSRVRIGCMKFRECGKLLRERKVFFENEKDGIYRSCVKSAMLYESETWCLRESEMAILRTERALVRSMCGVKLVDRKKMKELMRCWV